MKIASIHLQNFKRFTDLKIQNIPATAKLVVLLGPNGCGKSSVFDALHYAYGRRLARRSNNRDYYPKISAQGPLASLTNIEFHNPPQADSDMAKAIYARTAYRNTPVISVESIQRMPSVTQEARFDSMVENDATVTNNYQRLLSNAVDGAFNRDD